MSEVRQSLELIIAETQNNAVRNTASEALLLLASGVSTADIFVLSDDQWTQCETAMSRQEIESDETWTDWDAPGNAEDIANTLNDWIQNNSPPTGE